ncbi:PREDICTED: polyadenylation and cleavage factor homolog 4-like isoform X4 [Populus euphratica]|uniref:Polyadenylation and cleavage factor homolog 4-like isoform X4 n=1 Tax=Populus euphratica TaxID=75702 RepID=A0AAJ6UY00_POPEU|nr:PREDICTED: polyadenylation and cleavage factor homolog 4-like isoform X4 [Populus euphratica]
MQPTKLLNPKTATKAAAAAAVTTTMPNELLPQKPSASSVLDKFRSLLKQRQGSAVEDDGGGDGASLSMEDVVEIYETVLNELTFNSKPIITDLTIIAGEQREHGEGIADVLCARIVEAPVDQKLPSLYLLDSIVKNIGREYIRHFSSRLPEVFCEAYRQVDPSLYPSMRHLFGTWSSVFPSSVLHKIETQLDFSPQVNNQSSSLTSFRASESPRPPHGIHVNPKYLRQLDHSTADNTGWSILTSKAKNVIQSLQNVQHTKGTSNLKIYGKKPAVGYDEYESDQAEAISSQVGMGRTSLILGSNKLQPSSTSRLARRLLPLTTGAERPLSSEIDDLAVGNSPRRFVEGLSPSRPLFDYGHSRTIVRDEEANELRRNNYSDDNHNRFEPSARYRLSNGLEHQGPRALIDAYGDDRGKRITSSKPLHIEQLAVNGMHNKVASRSWQNTEEEEFDWEDMSPTLSEHGRTNDFLPSSIPPFGSVVPRPAFGRLSAIHAESDIRSNRSSLAPMASVDGSSNIAEEAVSILGSGRGSTSKIPGFRTERNQILGSRHHQEAWNFPPHIHQSAHLLNSKGRGRDFQMPLSGSGVSSLGGENYSPLAEKLPDIDAQLNRSPAIASRWGSNIDSTSSGTWSSVVPPSSGVWPPVNARKSLPPPVHRIFPPPEQSRSQFDPINASSTVINQVLQKGSAMPEQPFNGFENKDYNSMKPTPMSNQHAALNQQNQAHVNPFQPQQLPSHETRENFHPSGVTSMPPRPLGQPLNHGYNTHGHSTAISMVPSNALPAVQLPLPVNNIPNMLHSQVGLRPPLPPGPPPQTMPFSQNVSSSVPGQPSGSAFSGLFNSLMAQGLISLTKQSPVQDSVGLEFNADLLKLRYESAISALYGDLPRQCTTCGLRFKCQEEHSTHMDWHVTKNRMSKNRKQKSSRNWFVSASMWLSGAEALGTDAAPGFLPTETTVEKKDDHGMAVPADEEQSTCALCGEPFDDFYSDETEEWMYRGAVYLNSSNGSTAGMDRSQLGPIVHAKCRSDSSVVPPEDFGHDEGVNSEEGNQRKRMRS